MSSTAAPARVLPAAWALPGETIERAFLLAGLAYAVCVSPFIGGIRGVPVAMGWLAIPLLWAWRAKAWRELGLAPGRPAAVWLRQVILSAAAGAVVAVAVLGVAEVYPELLRFLGVIPALHRDTVNGNIPLFLALIPVAHAVHELFYRGFLQSRLSARLGSPAAAILLAGLLYAWTHVFIYSSLEYSAGLSALFGPGSGDDVAATLRAVALFALLESVGAGMAFHKTQNLFTAVAFRAAHLITLCAVVFPRIGLL